MFTLITIGVGATFVFSIVAMFMSDLFPHSMQQDGKVTMIVMDKTVTLTEGKPKLIDVLSAGDFVMTEILPAWSSSKLRP
jgi:hypothetical protein